MISDTHNRHFMMDEIPAGDMIIHSGDFSMGGRRDEVYKFLNWFQALPHKHKVFIAGNHDKSFENNDENVAHLLTTEAPELHYLNNSSVTIEGIKIYGSPITPSFGYGWAFNRKPGWEIIKEWEKIPQDTDILVTHGPPLGYGDKVVRGGHNVGCPHLLKKIDEFNIKLHQFGHIHEGYGMYTHKDKPHGTTFVNASLLDEWYHFVNDPIVINYEDFI